MVTIDELTIAGDLAAWSALGFHVRDDRYRLGGGQPTTKPPLARALRAAARSPRWLRGAERIEERGLSHDEIALTKTGDVYTQSDGATAYVKEVAPGRFNVIIEGAKGVVTALKNIPQGAIDRLAKKYGWKA